MDKHQVFTDKQTSEKQVSGCQAGMNSLRMFPDNLLTLLL